MSNFKPRKKIVKKRRKIDCYYCTNKITPSYKEMLLEGKIDDGLAVFVNDRAKLLGRDRSGLCTKHQRKVAGEVKRARHLALLPFTVAI